MVNEEEATMSMSMYASSADYWKAQAEAWQAEAEKDLIEIERLRAFARDVMEVWPMGDLDGGSLQEIATKHGLLTPEVRNERCGESCGCAEYATADEFASGVECYRKAAFLLTPNVAIKRLP